MKDDLAASDMPLAGLFDDLEARPEAFDPLMALRLAALEAERRGVPLQIRAGQGTGLAPVAVEAVRAEADVIEVETALTGLTGPLSPLPLAYTELAATDRRRRAGGLSAFLDLFADRMTRLFVAASGKYSLPTSLQWAAPAQNRVLGALRALIGAGDAAVAQRLPLPGDATLRYAGLFAQRTRSALGLQVLAEAELELPVRVVQFHRRWRPLAEADQTRLDGTRALGQDAVAGAFVPNRSGQVRLVIGPVRYHDFLSLEAGQPRLQALARLVQLYLGPVLEFDIQIVLDRRDVPETQLGGTGPAVRLGRTTWARAEPAARDSDEVVIDGTLVATARAPETPAETEAPRAA